MSAPLRFYAVLYVRVDGVVSCEDSGLCLSTASARAKECSQSLLCEAVWSESEQAWTSRIGNRVVIRPVSFEWDAIKDGR